MFRNDHRNDTTVVQVHLKQLETLSARFEPSYEWSRRYTSEGNDGPSDLESSSSGLSLSVGEDQVDSGVDALRLLLPCVGRKVNTSAAPVFSSLAFH